jgi:hypothetical protein
MNEEQNNKVIQWNIILIIKKVLWKISTNSEKSIFKTEFVNKYKADLIFLMKL